LGVKSSGHSAGTWGDCGYAVNGFYYVHPLTLATGRLRSAFCLPIVGANEKVIRQGNSDVAQTKKTEIRQAILDAAYELFSKRGYLETNVSDIACSAGVAPANLYVYFRSKLDILFSIHAPWLTKQFDAMEISLRRVRDPRRRLRKILSTLWREIPSLDNGLANNLMQALATTTVREGYSPALRLAIEERLARLLDDLLPHLGHTRSCELANIVLMAFDGYALNFHLNGEAICPVKRLALFADMLFDYVETGVTRRQALAATNGRLGKRAAVNA
jgi:AcrR family transcriptional regulator